MLLLLLLTLLLIIADAKNERMMSRLSMLFASAGGTDVALFAVVVESYVSVVLTGDVAEADNTAHDAATIAVAYNDVLLPKLLRLVQCCSCR